MKPRARLVAAFAAALVLAAVPSAHALQVQPDITKLKYEPIGHFKPGDPIPPANGFKDVIEPLMQDGRFNPSGTYNAYDTNVFEVLAMPWRAAGDEFADDPLGNGADGGSGNHGQCSGDPRSERPRGGASGYSEIAGECFNHQLEYIDYYERTMMDILGKFGAFPKRYEFHNPSDPTGDPFQPPLLASNTMGGRAINPAIVIPGTEKSDESIVIGAHYDKTNDGPAAAWDSQEGHAQMIRVAKIMADYWDATNSRPTATIKFIPWDGGESGTLGSQDYAEHVIPPGDEEFKVRGYWNTDPCAGGYPSFRFGNRANRTQLGIQLANPFRSQDPLNGPAGAVLVIPQDLPEKYHARINQFNDRAPELVEQVFEHLDDKLESQLPDQPAIFVSTAEGGALGGDIGTGPLASVSIGQPRPFLFSSDWRNFENRGIPFFNPGPEITGPSSFGDPGNPDALVILHSPFDNLDMLNRYAGAPQDQALPVANVAEGWVKGMEMCAQMLAWGMLQPDQGGASVKEENKLSAYYEALPNEAGVDEPVEFDASGSHFQTANGTSSEGLQYAWEFGDGTTGTGKVTHHRYDREGTYTSKLTVTNPANGQTATMSIPIVVQAVPVKPLPLPGLEAPPTDEDGTFDLGFSTLDTPSTLGAWEILESSNYQRLLSDDAEAPLADRWVPNEPTHPEIEPWQDSDSSTSKFLGNQQTSGEKSYWTGVTPNNFKPGAVQEGESILTIKEPFEVPAGSGAALTYNSLFLNESDDLGFVQIAEATGGEPAWTTIDQTGGATDVCSASDPAQSVSPAFRQRGADVSAYAGKKILVRFVYKTGATNPAASQPCGWYVDDIDISGGSFKVIDRSNTVTDAGQFFTGGYQVKDRAKGLYAYRVRGLYPPNAEYAGPSSNIRVVDVTRGGSGGPGTGGGGPGGGSGGPGGGSGGPGRPGGPGGPGLAPCVAVDGFSRAAVRRSGRGLSFRFKAKSRVTVDVFQTSIGRRVIGERLIARYRNRKGSFKWNGRARRVADGTYFVRYTARVDGQRDVRRVTLRRSNGRFKVIRPHYARASCKVLRSFKLSSPAFGGKGRKSLGIAFRLTEPARVGVTVRRGKKVVKRFAARSRPAGRTIRLKLGARKLKRGDYKVTLRATTPAGRRIGRTLGSRRL